MMILGFPSLPMGTSKGNKIEESDILICFF